MTRKLSFIALALMLALALIMPALQASPAKADGSLVVYVRILGPDDAGSFRESGQYQSVWEGNVTVPTEITFSSIAGNTWHLYVNQNNEYWAECTDGGSVGETYLLGYADYSQGATSVLAALVEASQQGGFNLGISDAYLPMGFFISAIDVYAGSGADGWCYRVCNPDDAGLSPIGADSFLLGYSSMPIATPHEQVLWYWGGSGCYPLKVTSASVPVEMGEEFTATVEYFRDYGHGPSGEWVTLSGATVEAGGETFTTDDNGQAQIYLESEGYFEVTASKGYDGNNIYVPTDDSTVVTVSGGDGSERWTQTTGAEFGSGTALNVDTSSYPGDVSLERGGTITEDYILSGGTAELGGEHFYDQFEISGGATLYITAGEPLIIHANYILIDSTSSINADGRGYDGGQGNVGDGDDGFGMGAGCGGVHFDVHGGGGGGGGHCIGGMGGAGSYGWDESASGGNAYGGTCQSGNHSFYLGSGGGGGGGDGASNVGGDGGAGGGAVRLEAPTVNIYGTVTACGEGGSNGAAAGCGGGGGGSGGTIYIACESYDITNGALLVQGGNGGNGGGSNGHGAGGGSGGYIKVFYENLSTSYSHRTTPGSRGTGDPYNGRNGYFGSGAAYSQWKQETFVPTEPYYSAGTLESASYDTASTDTDFGKIYWCASNPPGTVVKFQIASNNDNATWNFVGPDGTAGSYYTTSGTDICTDHDGNQYVKYKVFFSTTEPGETPVLSKVSLSFTSGGITEVISFTVTDYNDDGVNFGTLDPGQENQPADWGGAQGAITLTVGSETNVDVDIQIKGDNFSGPDTIFVTNVKYDVDTDPTGAGVMTDSYATWYTVSQPLSTDDIREGYLWLSVPTGQPPGYYISTFYYRAITSP